MEEGQHERRSRSSNVCPPPPSLSPCETPWLLYTHGVKKSKHKQCQTFTTISPLPPNNKSYIKSIPQLRDKSIEASCNGWLILRDLNDEYTCMRFILLNPVTLQSISLPEFRDAPEEDEIHEYTLISTPDLDDCVYIIYFYHLIFFCRPIRSDVNWVKVRPEIDGRRLALYYSAVLDNVIYSMAVIDAQDNQPEIPKQWTVVTVEVDATNSISFNNLELDWPNLNIGWIAQHMNLIESCGKVYCVGRFRRYGRNLCYNFIKVWELDIKVRNWVEVNTLDGRAFFVMEDKCCKTWCWGSNSAGDSNGVPGNSINYVMELDDTRVIYSYSLHDKCLTLLPIVCPSLIKPYNSVIWVMPQTQRFLNDDKGLNYKEMIKEEDTLNQGINTVADEVVQEQKEKLFCKLPVDLITESILKRLLLLEYMNFRATCKLFRSISLHHNPPLPSFMYFKDDSGLCRVFDPFKAYSTSIILQPSKDPYTIDFFKDGWLLVTVHHPDHTLKYLNPSTRVRSDYPPCSFLSAKSVGFSTNPTCTDCVTIGVTCYYSVHIQYHKYGDEKWTICNFFQQNIDFSPGTTSPVYHNGSFYLLDDKDGHLGAFKLVENEGSWQVYEKPPKMNNSNKFKLDSCHLLECNGHLYAVYFGQYGKWVNVFKFNLSEKNLVPVRRLENYCFFVSPSSSFSVQVTWEAGIRNRIYLPRFRGNGMVFYNLETCKYGVSGTQDSMIDWFNTSDPLNCCWI